MKRSVWTRILALVLVLCMLSPVTVSAAGGRGGAGSGSSASSAFQGLMDWLRGRIQIPGTQTPAETEAEETEAPETEAVETQPAETENTASGSEYDVMTLVEDDTTVENGDMLRASTYVLSSSTDANDGIMTVDDDDSTTTTLKYFPVTMYDYDAETINNATHLADIAADADLTEWQGIYFNDGSPSATSYTTGAEIVTPTFNNSTAVFEDGTYLIVNARSGQALSGSTSGITGTTDWSNATQWTISRNSDGTYYIKSGTNYYLYVGSGTNNTMLVKRNSSPKLSLVAFGGTSTDENLFMIKYGNYYLNQYGGGSSTTYGGYSDSTDAGSTFYLYKITDDFSSTASMAFAAWNWWSKNSGSNDNGQKTYTGLVESTLDSNKDIVFTKPDGGIFNSDSSVKAIYTNVEMPFVYDSKTGTYTFDASQNGVYFLEDDTQGSSGTAANNTRLYFDEGNTQSNGGSYGDGSTTVWAPYNDGTSFTTSEMNYHFGMRTTIPFTMTSNGRMNEANDSSEPIQFSFSGDDDVWVFIDGQLVVDLGGIHNRLDVTIDFAANTVTYSESNSLDVETGSYNDSSFALEQTLFGGLISQDRTTFAATDSHELTIFYLERGEGASNCKIQFNLPMKDTVTVTKHATQSWNPTTDDIEPLTTSEQAIVDNINFGFTLYKSTDGGSTYSVVANTNYKLLNSNGQVIDTPATDANGHFTLKNGQSARFVTTFLSAGTTYYVVEDDVTSLGFVTPDFNFSGTSADGFTVVDTNTSYTHGYDIPEQILATAATENKSYQITVKGSDESEDSLVFVCENYVNATLPNPSALPADDKIVIDYGLSVIIDALANDNYRGDSIEIIGVYGAGVELTEDASETVYTELSLSDVVTATTAPAYGTATIENGKITYQLTQQLTGVEVLNYVVKVTGSTLKNDVSDETVTAWKYGIATVYVIPATTMYYEEDFTGLVTYTNGKSTGWSAVGTSETDAQEPGVVGTHNDSPYGSDVAYLNDSGDSNGSSKYVSTTAGAAQFSYTFTGTGTSFYARTTNNTGYMKIVVSDEYGNTDTYYRDTYYETDDSNTILYNIPVFTYEAENYGTYTVTVTIAKAKNGTVTYHSDFWLDGIRVYQPLDTTDGNYSVATSAYASDAEANMTNVTLRTKLLSTVTYEEVEREVAVQRVDENGDPVYKEAVDEEGNTVQLPVYDNVTELVTVPVWPEDGSFVLFTDSDGAIQTAEEYKSIGPKEEVYVYDGQSVSFSLENWDPNTNKLYLGIKAPTGSGTVTVGSTILTISNAADCYYDISSYGTVTEVDGVKVVTFKITAGDGSLISLTNIKVTGNAKFTIVPGTDVDVESDEAES